MCLGEQEAGLVQRMRAVARSGALAASVASVAIAIGGCTMAPRYERPAAPIEQTYTGANATGGVQAADVGWRDVFPDSQLQDLIARALDNNRDLRIAALNVEAARAQYRIQRSVLVPSLSAEGAASSQRAPAEVSFTGESELNRQYSAGIGVTAFELDLFGRLRSLRRSALEQYFGFEEARTSAQLVLVSEVANAWLTLIADQELLKLSQETLQSQQRSFDLTRMRLNSGVSSEVDLHQSETAVRNAEVNIAAYERRVVQDRNALALLVGEPLAADIGSGERVLDTQVLAEDLPAGLPAELLERRPDIRAAEHALKAANADIGAARAAFFPSISLTGFYGQASAELSNLFEGGRTSWSFVPQLSVPIFAGGANMASLDLAKARKRIEIARYEQSIQSAFREVSDALVARRTLSEQLRAQEALTRAAENSYRLSDMRYRGGVDSYLTSLIAQRDLYSAQQALITTRLAAASNLAQLYKALGGGWRESTQAADD
jgi:outer membrane protein, multidrug efflux system